MVKAELPEPQFPVVKSAAPGLQRLHGRAIEIRQRCC